MQSKQKTHIWLSLISVLMALLMCIPLAVTSFVYAEDYNGKKGPIPGDSDSKFPGNGCKLTGGEWGARVTLVYADTGNPVSGKKILDFSNTKTVNSISLNNTSHFGKVCKSDYRNDPTLDPQDDGYKYVYAPDIKALDSSGNAKKYKNGLNAGTATLYFPRTLNYSANLSVIIEDVKDYFTNYYVLQFLAGQWNMSKSDLESGKYSIILEPIIYFSYPSIGRIFAATVTEVALWQLNNSHISARFKAAECRGFWPSSMVLENWGFGTKFKPISQISNSSGIYSWTDMRDHMGINIISWDAPSTPPPTTIKVYYHLYNSSDVQTSLKTSTFDLGTSSTKQFTPSTAYGTPVAACVRNNAIPLFVSPHFPPTAVSRTLL